MGGSVRDTGQQPLLAFLQSLREKPEFDQALVSELCTLAGERKLKRADILESLEGLRSKEVTADEDPEHCDR